jgi:hypothetical protein
LPAFARRNNNPERDATICCDRQRNPMGTWSQRGEQAFRSAILPQEKKGDSPWRDLSRVAIPLAPKTSSQMCLVAMVSIRPTLCTS